MSESEQKKPSIFRRLLNPFYWLRDGMPLKGKIIIAVLLLSIMVGGGFVAFEFYDFTQNNPKFCVSCHLMQPAFTAWQESEHKGINCHDCHHLSIAEQNRLLVNFVLRRPESVPPRHGKIIVPWKFCIQCHWEKNEKYPDALKVNRSRFHAKHVFMEQIECAKCHGYKTHKFTVEERYCLTCHEGKEVHGTGMEKLACINCHTDRTADLKPGKKKCLFCHSANDAIRKELIKDGTIDVKHFQPSQAIIKKATKVDSPADAPMQFHCYECHKPHAKVRPDYGTCVTCHKVEETVGKHELHIKGLNMKCVDCHKPHIWRVTEAQAKKDCVKCHEYKEPKKFISS